MSEIKRQFSFFKEFSEEILPIIKHLYFFDNFKFDDVEKVYNKCGYNVLFVTINDECYAFGENSYGVLGFGHNIEVINPIIVKELCGKKIVEFVNGVTHCLALSSDGTVYCFGSNNFGQIGINSLDGNYHKPIKNDYFSEEIIRICCGYGHSVVLNKFGEIYAWGDNSCGQIGNATYDNQLIPVKIKGFIDNVVAIATGSVHSIALTTNGYLYSWGDNSSGQLGLDLKNFDSNEPQIVPFKKSSLHDTFVKKVQCGHSHTLLLTKDGEIFEFKFKRLSEIGLGRRDNVFKPTKVKFENKCIDIASHSLYNLSIALSNDNKFYIWGNWNSVIHKKPIQTEFKTFNEIFIDYLGISYNSINVITYEIISILPLTQYKKEFAEICCISSGSFAVVYKCSDIKDKTIYAVKKIPIKNKNADDIRRELKIMMKLNSQFTVRYKKSWIEKNYYLDTNSMHSDIIDSSHPVFHPNNKYLLHIQMELCQISLKQALLQLVSEVNGTISQLIKIFIFFIKSELFKEILEGIEYLHNINVIHRDLNPNNILITNGNNGRFVKIADFGLAVIHESDQSNTHTLERGSLKYMAPELIKTSKYDTKIDIYSLGVILEEMFECDEKTLSDMDNKIYNNFVKFRLLKVFELRNRMLAYNPKLRPNCKEIIKFSSSWFIFIHEILEEIVHFFSTEKRIIRSIDESLIKFFIQTKYIKFCESFNRNYDLYQKKYSKSINSIANFKFNKYKNVFNELSIISSESYGIICKVISNWDRKLYALKVIPLNETDIIKFHKELNILYELKSKYIVEIFSVWVEENYFTKYSFEDNYLKEIKEDLKFKLLDKNNNYLLHIQMELGDKTLKELIFELKKEFCSVLNPTYLYITSQLFIEVIENVEYLHKKHITHRDLRPENILITIDNKGKFVKISDYRLSAILQSRITDSEDIKYTAPEVSIDGKYDRKSDIYSLGVIMKELFNFNFEDMRNSSGINNMEIQTISSLFELNRRMLSIRRSQRPSCREILYSFSSLSLNYLKKELQFTNILRQQEYEKDLCNSFIVIFIKKKLERLESRRRPTHPLCSII